LVDDVALENNMLIYGNDTTKGGYSSTSEVRLETAVIKMLVRTYAIRVWEGYNVVNSMLFCEYF
jgi:hypothetical protein